MAGSVPGSSRIRRTWWGVSESMKQGDQAPQLTLLDSEHQEVEITSLWQDQPLALFFTRHMG